MPDDRKAKSVGKKIFNYGQVSTNITTKHRPKHGLYTMLCFRFNEAQRIAVKHRFNVLLQRVTYCLPDLKNLLKYFAFILCMYIHCIIFTP